MTMAKSGGIAFGGSALRNFLGEEDNAMRLAFFLAALLLPFSAIAADRDRFNLIGEWEWNPIDGVCPERFTYRADGMAMMQSGDERLVKTYVIAKAASGMYRVASTVKATNGKADCRGHLSPVGTKSSVFLMPTKGGGFLTCSSPDQSTCFGTAKAAKRKR